MQALAQTKLSGYKGPSYHQLRGPLLEDAVERTRIKLKPWAEHAERVTGYVLTCDGWTDPQGRPIITVALVSPKGAKYLKSIDCSGQEKNADFLADRLGEVIEETGKEHIWLVAQDGASANVAANEILRQR